MDGPKTAWSPATRTLSYEVTLSAQCPADDVRIVRRHPPYPDRVTRYLVNRVTVRSTWQTGPGAPEDQEAPAFVTLYVRQRNEHGILSNLEGKLFLDQIDVIPPWLAQIITAASPRDVP